MRSDTRVVAEAVAACGGTIAGAKITVLGAAFKPNSDDIRDSPALDVALRLSNLGANVVVTDPEALHAVRSRYPEIPTEADTRAALTGADLVLLLTEWNQYTTFDPSEAKELVSRPIIIDGRNALPREQWVAAGWSYSGLGRH